MAAKTVIDVSQFDLDGLIQKRIEEGVKKELDKRAAEERLKEENEKYGCFGLRQPLSWRERKGKKRKANRKSQKLLALL